MVYHRRSMNRKKTAGRKVSGMAKILAAVVVIAMVMLMSRKLFAISDMGGADNIATLHRHATYAEAERRAANSSRRCAVTVVAFSGNTGASNYADAVEDAYTYTNSPNTPCTYSSSTHRVYITGATGSTTYYSKTLYE